MSKVTPQQEAALRTNAIAKFAARVGQRESPSNRCEIADAANRWVGNPLASPYCAASSIYCTAMAAEQMGLTLADTTLIKTGYCPDVYLHAKKLNVAVDPRAVVRGEATVRPGDLVLVFEPNQDGGLLPHHCETVTVAPTKGVSVFQTIGANTIPDGYTGDESRGIGVFRKRRDALSTNPGGHNRYVFVRLFPA